MSSPEPISPPNIPLESGRAVALVVSHPFTGHSRQYDSRLATRAVLHSVLAKAAGSPLEALRFHTTANGKPYLADAGQLFFNLSHSRTHSLIALSLSGDIGCDIEDRFRDDDDVDELGALVLHPVEQQEMKRLAPADRQEAFKRYWVRKEAVLKAAGSGFLKDPRAVIVGLDRAQPSWGDAIGPVLNLHEKQLGADCFAAVASADATCSWHLLTP